MSCKAWRSDWAALWKAWSSRRSSAFSMAACWAVLASWGLPSPRPVWPAGWLSGAIWSITVIEPLLLTPASPRAVPPRMPPEPLVDCETLAGAK